MDSRGVEQQTEQSKSAHLRVAEKLERYNLEDYLDMSAHPWSLIWRNFLAGIARGFGIAVGATLLVALALVALKSLGTLPLIGHYSQSIIHSLKEGTTK